ncbi:MAG: GNAT family N-acetyltransferase [Desulfobacterales bacterium]|nr:MAG: GNAT family N-acetyltransferase [Desulfobacterales bacterium]
MKITFATAHDEPEVKQMLAANGLHFQDITANHLKHFLRVRDASRLVGLVGLEVKGPCALLRSLAVDSQYRGRGLGSRLVQRAEEHAQSLQVDTVYLLTLTAEDFFARRGYVKTDRQAAPAVLQETAEFENLCPATAVCMVKQLSSERRNRQV